jgi:uncharacterized damage-inducible protein DinB
MAHHLVRYLQHVRREFLRALEGIDTSDLERSVEGLNSVRWMIGHLAAQEQAYWLEPRGEPLVSEALFGYRRAVPERMESPERLLEVWWEVGARADEWLLTLSHDDLRGHLSGEGIVGIENIGSLLTRVIGHYYLHIGQITVIRKLLGYEVPSFVGSQEGAYFE